jgi:hypothetical protein
MTFLDVPSGGLKAPKVQRKDIFAAIRDFKASVAPVEIAKLEEWTKQFGSEGS